MTMSVKLCVHIHVLLPLDHVLCPVQTELLLLCTCVCVLGHIYIYVCAYIEVACVVMCIGTSGSILYA